MDDVDRLAEEVRAAETVVALTGAGISAPSGVPTFRGDDGVWERFEEGQFTYGRFQRDPAGFWRDRIELQEAMYGDETYEPNAAHEALARLGAEGPLEAIVTQNVDGLHGRAARAVAGAGRPEADEVEDGGADAEEAEGDGIGGTDSAPEDGADVIELHGNSRRIVCTECGTRYEDEPVMDRVREGEVPPRCSCGGVLKPDVVLFGEQLPAAALQRARSLARGSDVFLAVGSSLVVEPAASLPRLADAAGATLAVVNLEPTPCDDAAPYVLREDVTTVLPALADRALSE